MHNLYALEDEDELAVRAATFDELLGNEFESLPGEKDTTDLTAKRLAAWCRSCASGDWGQFSRRLALDGLQIEEVLKRFGAARRKPGIEAARWIHDWRWIRQALERQVDEPRQATDEREPYAFEHLFRGVVAAGEQLAWQGLNLRLKISETARRDLRRLLLKDLISLCAPALYDSFRQIRQSPADECPSTSSSSTASIYDRFIAEMRSAAWLKYKPVLIRLIAVITRQWIDAVQKFLLRLDHDIEVIESEIVRSPGLVMLKIEASGSDRHNDGQSVLFVTFSNGSKVVYKPKNSDVDVAWNQLLDRLNGSIGVPIDLKAARTLSIAGEYGWTEFVEHAGCSDQEGFRRFFRRAGALLALLHRFAASDMHQENIIASGEYPIPIDLETLFHVDWAETGGHGEDAIKTARKVLANSVMSTGLLPSYGRSAFNQVFAMGGMTSGWNTTNELAWSDINSDAMRPIRKKVRSGPLSPNLPHIAGEYAKLVDFRDDFISGFEAYARFLLSLSEERKASLLSGFQDVTVRQVVRSTRFYYMLQQRLKNHKSMDDGVLWSVQADFIARLADDRDVLWPVQKQERAALLNLNIPHFVSHSAADEIRDATGFTLRTRRESGFRRAEMRNRHYDAKEINWQLDVIRENIFQKPRIQTSGADVPSHFRLDAAKLRECALAQADKIAEEIARLAIRVDGTAAWIGRDWLEEAEAFQLGCLGLDLYNGLSGVALFLAAHAKLRQSRASRELAYAAIKQGRAEVHRSGAAKLARTMGIGGATGLSSVVYAFTTIASLLSDRDLLQDAITAAGLMGAESIRADKRLDVISGSAGAILSLLRLYRETKVQDVLERAVRCGEHLLSQRRSGGPQGRSWVGQGINREPLTGISHGAAGFAYALGALFRFTQREEFEKAALECLEFENANYDPARKNWADLRTEGEPQWPMRWCHGAPGIGLARSAMLKIGFRDSVRLQEDIVRSVECERQAGPSSLDTLCCGNLGRIEHLREAANVLGQGEFRTLADDLFSAVLVAAEARGDYRWDGGDRRFNLGLFRGLAGMGYVCLRQIDAGLPNVLIWE
jgi:type 2 lantibiotic biosynthesis protein LanM